jgi:polysaccharide export outer membrane protein
VQISELVTKRVLQCLQKSRRRRLVVTAAAALLTIVGFQLARAQSVSPDILNALTPEMLRALQQGGANVGGDSNTLRPTVETYAPIERRPDQSPPSRLEEIYLRRSGEFLKQFGYDVLGQPSTVSISQSGALADAYVLGVNDELVVTFRGQENSTFRVRVNRDGSVVLPKLSPILAAGRRFGDFRADLEAQVSQAYVSTKVFVTPGSLHQMSILVSGEVRDPGSRIVSGLANPLDVILLSGGIKKTGSLRNVRVSGPGGTRIVDLYSVIAQGGSRGLGSLLDGDTVFVPPIGSTAAVAGAAVRPAIYELPSRTAGVSASTLLRLAGGVEIAGSYSFAKISVLSNGKLSFAATRPDALVRSGEVLVVVANHMGTEGRISLRGAVAAAGVYPLTSNPTAGDLFHSAADLSFDGYSPLALILRRDPTTNAVTIVPFSIAGAVRRTNNVPLMGEDLVYVMTRAEVAALTSLVTKSVNQALSPLAGSGGSQQPLGATSPTTQGSSPPQEPPYTFGRQAPPAGQELPPGIEPPPGYNRELPLTTGASGAQAPSGTGGNLRPDAGATYPDASATYPNASNVFTPNFDPTDPRFVNGGQSDSAEARALAQARTLASRNGSPNPTILQPAASDAAVVDQLARLLHVTSDTLLRTASDNLVWVLDDVRDPGPYLGAPGSSLTDMIQAAGGPQQTADLSSIEVTSTAVDQNSGITHTTRSDYAARETQIAAVVIRPLDVIRLRPTFSDREQGTVTVAGQVRFPGEFDIKRDEHLSELLKRAGGLSEVAFPFGAIFTRRDAAIAERQGNERSARELESGIPSLIRAQTAQSPDIAAAAAYLSSLARTLRATPALGRVVITADPAVLAIRPELDFVLQAGDTLFVPKRPSTVTVSGEVLNPGAFQYRSNLLFSDYVRLAGGVTQSADASRTFVIFPDGSSAPVDTAWLSFGGIGKIPPGSTIVVPRDLTPFNWTQFLKDVTQIASQLALTAASLSVLNNN